MTRRVSILRHTNDDPQALADTVAVEEPLQLWIQGKAFATLMRSPGSDSALAAGFLFSEGIITGAEQIISLRPTGHPTSQELHIELSLAANVTARSLTVSSSCGVCGRSAIAGLLDRRPEIAAFPFEPRLLYALPERVAQAQQHFASTGGLHAAALFDESFELLEIAEDVGRHNALDKLIGGRLLAGKALPARCLVAMTSRASFDIAQKCVMAAIPALACFGAASSLAIDLSRASGLRLFSFLRDASVVELTTAIGSGTGHPPASRT